MALLRGCRQFFPTRYKVVAREALSAAIRLDAQWFKNVVPLESRFVKANVGALTSNRSFYHLGGTSIVALLDVSAANCPSRLSRAPASAAIANQL
jgi:hypothetical protein